VNIYKGKNVTFNFARLATKLLAETETVEKFPRAAGTMIVSIQWPQLKYEAEW